jgi:hypothetical protein
MAAVTVTLAQDTPVTVYVFSVPSPETPGGFIDKRSESLSERREESAQDLKKALSDKKRVKIVDDPKEARIRVEVAWRSSPPSTFNILKPGGDLEIAVRARLVVGEYSLHIVGKPSPIRPGWRGAAENVARQVDEWIKMNQDRLQSPAPGK